MSSRYSIQVHDRHSNQLVDATLIHGPSKVEIDGAEKIWRPFIREVLKDVPIEQRPHHAGWNWAKKHESAGDLLLYEIWGVECAGSMQGLMLLQTANMFCRIEAQQGKGLVYVAYLETAPWNLPKLVENPRYKLVGSQLIKAAIETSQDLEFKGRIGLLSKPEAEEFYSKCCGMTDLGPNQDPSDPEDKSLRYFEMTPAQASEFLDGGAGQ